MKFINRIGETNFNKCGFKMTIINYINCDNIIVEFDNGFVTKCQYGQFKKGNIKSPLDKTVLNIGCLGGNSITLTKEECAVYNIWKKIIERCYCDRFKLHHNTYKDCTVCDEWHNFRNFYSWYKDNYYSVEDEQMEIDKDLLVKNNKIYSPNTCVILPSSLNCLIIKSDKARGDLPIGVYYKNENHKYVAQCNTTINNKRKNIHIGYYDNYIDAFNGYKEFKEGYIKLKAEEFKSFIPNKAYKALINYKVNICD